MSSGIWELWNSEVSRDLNLEYFYHREETKKHRNTEFV